MKEGWKKIPLGEICDIVNGRSQKAVENENGQYPIYGSGGIMGYADLYLCEAGSTVIGRKGTINRPIFVPTRFWNVDTAFGIKCREGNDKFFFYLFKSIDFTRYNKSTTLPSLVKSDLLKIEIPVPPISEQELIVAELDLLSSVIEKKKAQLKELDNLAQSIFYDMFGDPITNEKGWETRCIKEGVEQMFLGPFGSSLKTECYVEKTRSYCMVYEQKHAIKKTLDLDNHYIDKDKYFSLQRFEVNPGDIIMSCRGTIGEIYQLPDNAPKGIIHPSLMKIRLKQDFYNHIFFKTILRKIVANEDTNGGCVQMAITAKALGNKRIIYPSPDLQDSFAAKIGAIEQQKSAIKKSIDETQALFDSRMDYYFN